MNCFLKFTASYTLYCQFNTNYNREVSLCGFHNAACIICVIGELKGRLRFIAIVCFVAFYCWDVCPICLFSIIQRDNHSLYINVLAV